MPWLTWMWSYFTVISVLRVAMTASIARVLCVRSMALRSRDFTFGAELCFLGIHYTYLMWPICIKPVNKNGIITVQRLFHFYYLTVSRRFYFADCFLMNQSNLLHPEIQMSIECTSFYRLDVCRLICLLLELYHQVAPMAAVQFVT